MNTSHDHLGDLEVPVRLSGFLRSLVRNLTASLEDVIGPEDASGFISIVGQKMGQEINCAYADALSVQRIPRDILSAVMVDFKDRIGGDFEVLEETDDRIVLGARKCPFGEQVKGRPSLCTMTTSVFGVMAAQSQGYAKVSVDEAIARGHAACRITIYLDPATARGEGKEFYRVDR